MYLQILNDKAIPSTDIYKLKPLVTGVGSTKKLPYQVRLFRAWARTAFKLIKRVRRLKEKRVDQVKSQQESN